MRTHCIAYWCPMAFNCGIFKKQTSTDGNSYFNHSDKIEATEHGYYCPHFVPIATVTNLTKNDRK